MIDTSRMLDEGNVPEHGGFANDSEYLEMTRRARRFLESRRWCHGIRRMYFDRGFKHLCVFYAEILNSQVQPPDVWIVVGDTPPAYIPTRCSSNGAEALMIYMGAMSSSVENFLRGVEDPEDLPILSSETFDPLELSSDLANQLLRRLDLIAQYLKDNYPEEVRAAGYPVG